MPFLTLLLLLFAPLDWAIAAENYCLRKDYVVRSLELTTKKKCSEISPSDFAKVQQVFLVFDEHSDFGANDFSKIKFPSAEYLYFGSNPWAAARLPEKSGHF